VFYAPWCGYCKKLAPDFDRAAANMHGLVNSVAVDCDDDGNKSLCAEHGVQGYPTIKIFPGNGLPGEIYQGERMARKMVDYTLGKMPTFVKRLSTLEEVEKVEAKSSSRPAAVLFTSSGRITPLFKALSSDYHRDIDFYAARDLKVGQETLDKYEVKELPTLLVMTGGAIQRYDGKLRYDAIHAFLQSYKGGGKRKDTRGKSPKDEL